MTLSLGILDVAALVEFLSQQADLSPVLLSVLSQLRNYLSQLEEATTAASQVNNFS